MLCFRLFTEVFGKRRSSLGRWPGRKWKTVLVP